MKTVKIQLKQPYWGAWQKYGWEKGVPGFGVALHKILANDQIVVGFQGVNYKIGVNEALELAKKYNSYFVTNSGVRLIELPKTAFTI